MISMRCFKTYHYPLHLDILIQPTRVRRVEASKQGARQPPKFIVLVLTLTKTCKSRCVARTNDASSGWYSSRIHEHLKGI